MNIRRYVLLTIAGMLCTQPVIQAACFGPVASTFVANMLHAMSGVAVQQLLVQHDVCRFRGDLLATSIAQSISQSSARSQHIEQQMSNVLPRHTQQNWQECFRSHARSQLEFYTAKSLENIFNTEKINNLMLSSIAAKPSATNAAEVTVVATLQPTVAAASQERQITSTLSVEFQMDQEGWRTIQERIAMAAYEQMQLQRGEQRFFARLTVIQQQEPYYTHVKKTEAELHAEQMAIIQEAYRQQEIYRYKQQQADAFLTVIDSFKDICGDAASEVQCQEAVLKLIARCNGIRQKHIKQHLQQLQKQLLAEFFDKKTGDWLGFAGIGRAKYILFGHLEPMLQNKHIKEFLASVQRDKRSSYQDVIRNLRKAIYFTDAELAQAKGYQSSFTIDLHKIAQNPVNRRMICMIDLFKAGNIKEAEKLTYMHGTENKALKQLFFKLDTQKNECGIYQKYERDTAWINCPADYKKQIQRDKSLQETVNEIFAQRAIQKQQIAIQFGIPAYHTEGIDKFLYKLVSYADDVYTQTDFLVQAAQEYKEVAELFCLPNGLFKKFHASPWAQQFVLNKALPSFMQVKVLAGANNILSLPQEALSSEVGQRALQYIDYAARVTSADEAAVYTVLADALQAHLARGVTLPSALHEVNFIHHAGHEQHLQEFEYAHDYALELSQSIYTATMPNGLLKEFNDEAYAKRFKYQEGYSLAEHQEFADLLNKLFAHYKQEKQDKYRQGKKKTIIQAISYAIRSYEWPQERAYKIVAQGTVKALDGAPHMQFLENQENLLVHENRGAQSVDHQAEYAQAERLAEKITQQEEQAAANKAFADALLCEVPQENDMRPLCDGEAAIDGDVDDEAFESPFDEQADPLPCGSSPLMNDPRLKDFHDDVDTQSLDSDDMPTCNGGQQTVAPLTEVEQPEVLQEKAPEEAESGAAQAGIPDGDIQVQPAIVAPGTQEEIDVNDIHHHPKWVELSQRWQELADRFNASEAAKKLGIPIDVYDIYHMHHGNARRTKVVGFHFNEEEECCFKFVKKGGSGSHGEAFGEVHHIDGKYEPKRATTVFGADWTVEDVLNVIIDAVENDRVVFSKMSEDCFERKIHITTRCGMVIEIKYNFSKKTLSIYPEIKWIFNNKGYCDGRCKYKHDA